MSRIIYVRHGTSLNNVVQQQVNPILDSPLTEKGMEQATITATYLFKHIQDTKPNIITIIVSPYSRTRDTAKALIRLLVDNNIDYDLKTIMDCREYTPVHKIISDELSDYITHDADWPSFINRVIRFNDALKKETAADKLVIVFSHGLLISSLLSYQATQETYKGYTHYIAFDLKNCSLTFVDYLHKDKDMWRIHCVGNTDHLGNDILMPANDHY
jgi:broad specificity phosphatase PhoE